MAEKKKGGGEEGWEGCFQNARVISCDSYFSFAGLN